MYLKQLTAAALLSGFGAAGFACEVPALVAIPEADEMEGQAQRIQAEAREYFTGMEAYVTCLREELEAAGGDDAPELVRTSLIRRNNVAVAEAEVVMELYNEVFGEAAE